MPIQCQNELQNFHNIIRPFMNLTEKKSWPNTFKDLTNFYLSSRSMRMNGQFMDRIFNESLRAFEKIFKEKLYKNTVEEMVTCMATLFDSVSEPLQSNLLDWIFNKIYFQQSTSEENKLIILRCLSSIIIDCQSMATNIDNYFFIQTKLKKALETTTANNNIEIFLQIFQLIITIGKRSPNSLRRHIEDLMDILLGWYMDGTQTIMTLYLIENIILSFDFKQNLQFFHMLLRSFIEDIEKYYQESLYNLIKPNQHHQQHAQTSSQLLMMKSNETIDNNQQLHTIALRIRLFAIFYRKILIEHPNSMMVNNLQQNSRFCIDSMAIMIKTIINLWPFYKSLSMSEELLIECNQSLIILMETSTTIFKSNVCIQSLENELHDYCQLLFNVIDDNDNEIFHYSSPKTIITAMDFLKLFIKNSKQSISLEIVDRFFNVKFQSLKFSLNKKVLESFISLFYCLLKIKSVEIIDKSYRHILSQIRIAFDFLHKIKRKYNNKQNGNVEKNDSSPVIVKNFDDSIPQQQQQQEEENSAMTTVQSNLMSNSHNPSSLRFSPNSHASNYFVDILKNLKSILSLNKLKIDSIIICLRLVENIVTYYGGGTSNQSKQASIVIALDEFIFANNYPICKLTCSIIMNLLPLIDDQSLPMYWQTMQIYRRACEFNIAHTDKQISELYVNLLSSLPICSMTKKSSSNRRSTTMMKTIQQAYSVQNKIFIHPEESHLTIVCVMNKTPSEHFSSLAFEKFFDFIQNGHDDDDSLQWLFRTLYASIDDERMKIPNQIRSTLGYLPFISSNNNLDLMKMFQYNYWTAIFWICFEFVQHCIENRLKTPLGKPQDTFTKIESLIKMFVADISSNSNVNRLAVNVSCVSANVAATKPNTIRIHMLLMIMDNFDKLIYNAIHGNSLRLYVSSKLSKQFFKKNRATCSEWLNRNRRSLMVLASKVGQLTIVVHHGQELLRNYQCDRTLFTLDEIEFILLLMIDSLIQMKASETIRGYYNWVKQYLGVKFVWIKAATDEANGRYERALIQYRNLLQNKVMANNNNGINQQPQQSLITTATNTNTTSTTTSNKNNPNTLNLISSSKNFICNSYTVNFFRKRILNCLLNIENYDDALEWWQIANRESNKTNVHQMACNLFGSTNIDYSYLKSLSTFADDDHDENMTKPTLTNNNNLASSIDHPLPLIQRSMFFDIESSYHQIQSKLFELANQFFNRSSTDTNSKQQFIEQLDDLIVQRINPLIRSFNMCGMVVENHFAMLQKISHQLRAIIQPTSTTTTVDKIRFDLFEWEDMNLDQLINGLSWYRVYAKLNEKTNHIEPVRMKHSLNRLLLKTARKARKTQNIELAEKLLFQFAQATTLNVDTIPDNTDRLISVVQNSLNNASSSSSMLNQNLLDFCYETSEYLHDKQESKMAVDVLLKSVNVLLETKQWSSAAMDGNNNNKTMAECTSRMFLKLVHYIQSESYECCREQFITLDGNPKLLEIDEKISCIQNLNHFDNISGKLLLMAVNNCPSMSKAWYQLGDWCYRWGRRLSDIDIDVGEQQQQRQQLPSMVSEDIEKDTNGREANIIEFYKLAANSYIRFLHINGHNSCDDIDATLRLLRLILKHAPELREILEIGLKETPTKPWKNITLQLFSRLNHHEPYTKLFVHELRRITVLWDELWIGIMQHSMNEMKKQVVALEKEIEKTRNNTNLYEKEKILFIKEQHNIFFRRLLYSLQLTNMLTSSDNPETPHEEWFQKNFNQLIQQLIESIACPENYYEPSNILFNYQNLFQTIRKRSLAANNYRFYMQDISPRLATLENTVIPLPGLNGSNVMLKGVFKTVSVLHTYTKPKKIILIGSDGRNYSYLFKGHEDLHLDERIMQFLSIVNQMISKFGPTINQQNNNSNINYDRMFIRARNYSVTPLGNKSGLIQWVEGGHALYNLYKRWLSNRDISLDEINKRVSANEIFKMKLAEHGITTENRNDWNMNILHKVFDELSNETPDDLIVRELWCSSVNSFDHWNLQQNFITSNAIMSVIGYILGLGDRHLDNILLDLTTGEVIHIDYNICFEKGKTLRVPEMVLCRLTQNIVNTFGVTGVDGKFRIACENVLKILRKGKETLLTLLEAFVYDPLIDWTPEHEEGFTGAIYGGAKIAQLASEGKIIPKKQMEKENQDAIERLKQLMKSVEQRNSDWPKIVNTDNEPPPRPQHQHQQQDLRILAKPSGNNNDNEGNQQQHQQQMLETRRHNKRNVYAFSVWKRIRMKLDGRDPDPNRRLSIYDQVNHLIKESTSMENLSRMYEGWTSWV
ncbi:Serine/threonine-protein kinase smg1 [Dermatophagoides farinae]|uniref:non-specific serine/threonine protein kinase n=1 Tax=Dermatophagoides farinae TaxID=6954 RepID=A0A922I8N6_DERFA|nr:Serine/threonine-protein kinase smg1 [Dermatophagoides farinae]